MGKISFSYHSMIWIILTSRNLLGRLDIFWSFRLPVYYLRQIDSIIALITLVKDVNPITSDITHVLHS